MTTNDMIPESSVRTVLVTAVRGKTGAPLAHALHAAGVTVRGGSTRPETVDLPGVTPTLLDWDDPSTWSPAVDGVDAIYLVRSDRPDAPEVVRRFLDVVPDDMKVVLLSERRAEDFGPDGWAPRVEEAVTGSGRPWVVLRPGWFAQVFTDERFYRDVAVAGGQLSFASGGADVAWIDARDIADVATAALLTSRHDGELLELTGPEGLSLARTAEILSRHAATPVEHVEISVDEAAADASGFERELLGITFERLGRGSFADVTGEVERVTGRPARTLDEALSVDLRP